MAKESSQTLEGIFAINKPASLSSAQVLRDLQHKFAQSKTFAPLLRETERKQEEQNQKSRKRKRQTRDGNVFKMGHGGTLDPMATGVLIVGIGRGTKSLGDFLDCTKTYETVVLFGKSTDSYDVAGKVVADAPYSHITREVVAKAMGAFRGDIQQVPPIYSALKINGMKAYEYARTGKELPRQLESRSMKVSECELLEWYEGGTHDFRWPAAEATGEEKDIAKKFMKVEETRDKIEEQHGEQKVEEMEAPAVKLQVQPEQPSSKAELNAMDPVAKAALHTHTQALSDTPADGPAAKIRVTVSSGFYVRSFAHDLGIACESFGAMATLLRSRQADFTSITPPSDGLLPALTYEELEQGEDIWGPKVSEVLQVWLAKNPVPLVETRTDARDNPMDGRKSSQRRRDDTDTQVVRHYNGRGSPSFERTKTFKRRNSSSPERDEVFKRAKTTGTVNVSQRRNSSSPE